MTPKIDLVSTRAQWRPLRFGPWSGYAAGLLPEVENLAAAAEDADGLARLGALLAAMPGPFALILRGRDWALAAVDKARRIPVFYRADDTQFAASDDAFALAGRMPRCEIDTLAVLEMRAAGYVSGARTLLEGLAQLRAGEFVFWRADGRGPRTVRYFRFPADIESTASAQDLIEECDEVFDRAVRRTIDHAAGRPICVPLSAGLDSRLVLAKLKQHKYDNLLAFSYGAPGNYEAKGARYVAERVGVRWRFFPDLMREGRALAAGPVLGDYWDYASGLSAIPMSVDFPFLKKARERSLIPADAVIVNGQSGDYITGGHLKENLLSSRSRADLLAAIREKHFGLWRPLLTAAHRDAIDSLVVDAIGAAPEAIESGALPLWKAGFGWEWQERQAKFVVNGQRAYEFFGYDWALPLWDDGVIDFWSRIPPRLLLGQALYRNFLEKMNFFGVFRDFPVKVWRWPGASIAFVPIARAAALMFGSRAKARVYAVAGYWGHTRYLWAQYGFAEYRRHLAVLRNYHSLNARSVLARLARSLGRERDLDAALLELGIAERA